MLGNQRAEYGKQIVSAVSTQLQKEYGKKDFEANANAAFQKAIQNGWIDEMVWLNGKTLNEDKLESRDCGSLIR